MKHRANALRKFANAARLARAHMPWGMPGGFFMTDPARIAAPLEIITGLPGGIGVIIRHFGRPDAITDVADIVETCNRAGRICLIGADPGLARELGADGVHWPARLAMEANRHGPRFSLNTMSAHSFGEIRLAERLGMDGVIVSTVFPSESPSAGIPMGLPRLASLTRSSAIPVYGLGGVSAKNVERTAKIAGFASVSAFDDLRAGLT